MTIAHNWVDVRLDELNRMGNNLPHVEFGGGGGSSSSSSPRTFCQLADSPAHECPVGITSEEECVAGKVDTFASQDAAGCFDERLAGNYASTCAVCVNCLLGTFSKATEADDAGTCQPCEPGSYSDQTGSTECVVYSQGTWPGTPATLLCAAGRHTDAVGATSESTCRCILGAAWCVGC